MVDTSTNDRVIPSNEQMAQTLAGAAGLLTISMYSKPLDFLRENHVHMLALAVHRLRPT